MRLPTALALGVATGTIATAAIVPAGHAAAATAPAAVAGPNQPPTCGDPASREFPVRTVIRGGPATYWPGSGFQTWQLELTNTTGHVCRGIHPVVVLTDRDRVLRASQVRMEFFDEAADRQRPATMEQTDEDEAIGVFEGGTAFPGFTVEPGGTLTVDVRLAFTADALPNEVVAEAAVVQRKGDDGDWVGDSADYRFAIAPADDEPADPPADGLASTGARTGAEADRLRGLGLVAGGLVLGGGVLVVGSRRHRRG
ncbi:hypothetical protein NLX86_15745 [Streptomyces sp. A3M-1-3]|uniref:hypothetical protein n=1 Tax=Streptomyces sp. A3M-1-3 TaxID=2962044 RepID=UPI0020B7A708|nr:hypothetical protein [Streptomyces sp. A3M-1-3]MCP3819505.1 hypothetical protein [Streptomyces sp. A3M-1-3]